VRSGYDLAMLAMPGGRRRLANVRKLMRLGREHEALHGRDLRGFLSLVRGRASGWEGARDSRESEAPVEGEALDAVRLMTIHRAKGLEFEIVCVADLGRSPRRGGELLRIGRDGRLGMRLAEPGTGKRTPALDYKALGDEQLTREEDEERRLFYVAMTRARERLIVSGAARFETLSNGNSAPMHWIAKALLPDLEERLGEGAGIADGVRFEVIQPGDECLGEAGASGGGGAGRPAARPGDAAAPAPAVISDALGPPVAALSYSSLAEYERCGYRFYAERVLGLPPVEVGAAAGAGARLSAADRGILLHALLERLDFRRPALPDAHAIAAAARRAGLAEAFDAEEIAGRIEAFAASELCARLGRATGVRHEERFAFLIEGSNPLAVPTRPSASRPAVMVTGALDVLAREPGGRMLVVDYKSDRLDRDPGEIVASEYAVQRLIYAIAALRAGAREVEVSHVFLEAPERPVTAAFVGADADWLERDLAERAAGVLERRFTVTEEPQRAICHGCPAEGGLCSWPLAMTRRESPDRLF
jgi:ATP-dependent exoDNAse (exonuclease V) beta subunit